MRTALYEGPVKGTTACVCSVNELHLTIEVNRMDSFSRYHNFKFDLNRVKMLRAYGVGQGRLIPYEDVIVKPHGPTDLVMDFFPLMRLESTCLL